jgi:opacity protein-like surface antigen
MRFRTVVVAALALVLAITASLAVLQIAEDSRRETAQDVAERNDSLAVEPNISQKLVSDTDHDPTRYNDTINVTYNGTQFQEGQDYAYNQSVGEITFLVDEPGEANISYSYDIPEAQVADEQLQTTTVSTGLVMRVAVGLAFVILFLFIGGFAATRIRADTGRRGR